MSSENTQFRFPAQAKIPSDALCPLTDTMPRPLFRDSGYGERHRCPDNRGEPRSAQAQALYRPDG